MFNNIGGKIKTIATCFTWISMILDVILGIAMIILDQNLRIYGLIFLFVGPISSWIWMSFLYGFGQLVENSDILVDELVYRNENNIENKT